MASTAENNNEVLRRLLNDPDVIELKNSMNEILPNSVAEGEVVVDNDHLLEAGYIHGRIGFCAIRETNLLLRNCQEVAAK